MTSVTIPNSVTTIGEAAFYNCSGLTSVTIPNSVTSIGEVAFDDCTGLTSVTIPNSVTSIGAYAFANCSGLESIVVEVGNTVYDSHNNCNAIIETATNTLITGCKNTTIPNSVTSIGEWAFSHCYGLASVTIPNSVTSIGYAAFSGCNGLKDIYCKIKDPSKVSLGIYTFYEVPKQACRLHAIRGTKELFQNAEQWRDFLNIVDDLEEPGDVNGDGAVNVSDVTTLVNMILFVIPKDMTRGDIDGNGIVNVSDVTALVNIILGIH